VSNTPRQFLSFFVSMRYLIYASYKFYKSVENARKMRAVLTVGYSNC